MHKDIESILVSEEKIKEMVADVAARIDEDYKDKELLLIGVLKGSICFMSDIMQKMKIDCKIDFVEVSSYGNSTVSSGRVNVIKDVSQPLEGKHVVIIEDIIDSGNTLSFLEKYFVAKNAESVSIATLFDKPERRKVQIPVNYIGMEIPDAFIVGYGLDYAEKYRNLPYVGILKPEVYS